MSELFNKLKEFLFSPFNKKPSPDPIPDPTPEPDSYPIPEPEPSPTPDPGPSNTTTIVTPKLNIIDVRSTLPNNPRGIFWSQFTPNRPLKNIKFITVHHTADNINDINRINQIEINNKHAYKLGYPRIPYHFWRQETAAGGKIYWCNNLEWVTWHARNANPSSISIALVGNYANREPDQKLLTDLEMLLKKLLKELNLPIIKVFGHGELGAYGNATACPGSKLLKYIKNFRKDGAMV